MDLHEARTFLGTLEDMCKFQIFLRGTAGHKILLYWIDAERYRCVTKKEQRRFAYREIQTNYLQSGSPRELPESLKFVSICGPTTSFNFPKSGTERMHPSGLSIFSENIFIPRQKMVLQRLSSYWLPKFIQHKKIIRKLIAEKREAQSDFSAETRRLSPVPELQANNPVSRTRSEQEMDDFMEAQCVSSTESVADEEIRARKLEEWKRWFWEGTDSRAGSETKIEPPDDMPLELRHLGGVSQLLLVPNNLTIQTYKFSTFNRVIRFNLLLQIRGEDDTTSAPPSSPVLSEKEDVSLNAISEGEEDEYFSDDTDEESQKETKSKSFSHPLRHRLVTTKERSSSEPALPTDIDWGTRKTKVETTTRKPRSYAQVVRSFPLSRNKIIKRKPSIGKS